MKIKVIILFFLMPLFSISQTDTIAHLHAFGGGNNDVAEEIEATSDGGYIVVGSTSSNSSGNTDAYLLKIDSNCSYQWSKALGGINNDWGYSVKQTYDKGYIIGVSSNSYGNGGYDACLMKRDSLGNYQWKKCYGGNDWDFVYSVVQTHDSGYVFCGETYNNTSGFSDVYVVKTNQLGDTAWTRTVGGALVDKGNSIIETSDSNIVVAGIKNTVIDSTQIYVLKFDFNGTLLWDSLYGDSLYESAAAIIECNNGDYVIGGTSTSLNVDKENYIIRTNSSGLSLWANYFNSTGDEEVLDVVEDKLGNLINVGYTEGAGGGMKDVHVFYVNGTGFWMHKSSTYGGSTNEVAKSIALSNNIKIAGLTDGVYGNGLNDMLIVCLDTVYQGQIFSTDSIYDAIPLNIVDIDKKELSVEVYPNPAQSFIIISSDKINNGEVRVLDMLGNEVLITSFISQETILLNNLAEGIYLIKVYNDNVKVETKKIIMTK